MSVSEAKENNSDVKTKMNENESDNATDREVENEEQLEQQTEANAAETEDEEEEQVEEEDELRDDRDGFAAIGRFSSEVLDVLSQPLEPLEEEERKPKPLSSGGKEYKDILRLLQVWWIRILYSLIIY